ncbi:MAG: OmpH family outer membrane protein [Muribaculaceae bacterium]|nr:OmpH family outer membrane protein [Bacteroides sp.]MDE6680077.1 OmpH family outer membrane protein [Muribaculaceae bacterium]MDE6842591.1 OmpH family outer membrane protein [Muribaculaceae bacterium]
MKKTFHMAALALLAVAATACDSQEKPANKPEAPKKAVTETKKHELPNYRYVDVDSVLSKYNLAKDYNEEMLRMQNNMESKAKKHQNSLQSQATSIQNKLQNNGYLSEESYKQDQQRFANAQSAAEREMTSLQNDFQNSAMKAQQAVNDSVYAFIKEYNRSHGYDAIFQKAATLYIDPALDITDEVIEGLNARYNKVKK